MMLIIGLGNPGKKYEKTWHNVGSLVIDELKALNLEKVVLQKPQTFMNQSGKAVKTILRKHKLKPSSLIVIHDDIDLPLGKIRIVKNRGAAGHKGVESIIENLGTKNFIRLRIGIQPKAGKPKLAEKFVLRKFNKEDDIKEVIKKTAEAIKILLNQGLEKTAAKYNGKNVGPEK